MLAVWVGKLTVLGLRLARRRGTALPGLLVEKLFPRYLPRQLSRLADGVIVITGTNGKTTTTKMVATILGQRSRVLTNATGGNFIRGTIAAAVMQATWRGRINADIAVFELDEAHAVRFCAVFPPQRLLLLNVLRDQLDRFGEIDATAALVGKVAAATTGQVVLNRDDPRLVRLAELTSADVSYFGVAPDLRHIFPTDEELYGAAVISSELPASAELLSLPTGAGSEVTLRIANAVTPIVLRAEGAHNAQNAAAAAAICLTSNLAPAEIAAGLALVQPAFGRGQSFDIDGRRVVLQLVKNPSGFRQSLRTLATLSPDAVLIAINDDYADGRDMSWLWDVEFQAVLSTSAPRWLGTSGTRATDMALRLHYDELHTDLVRPELTRASIAAVAAADHHGTVVIFSTYTAMWELHRTLDGLASAGPKAVTAVGAPATGASG